MPLTWNRPHAWRAGRCTRCGMHSSWAGARHGCEGVSNIKKQRGAGRPRGTKGTCSGCGSNDHNRRTCTVSDVAVLIDGGLLEGAS